MNHDRFRFRFYHKIRKKYIENIIGFLFDYPVVNIIRLYFDNGYAEDHLQSEIILEQCSGFKCKNGLIFAGDKIKLRSGSVKTIEQRDGGFGWTCKFTDGEEYDFIPLADHTHFINQLDQVEIVGTIHDEIIKKTMEM